VTGSEIEQVLALFEPGVSLLVQKGNANGLIPMPQITLMLKVKDWAPVEKVIEQGAAGLGIRMEEVQYKNTMYRSYNPGLPGNIEAVYGYHGQYLVVGNKRQLLEKSLMPPRMAKNSSRARNMPLSVWTWSMAIILSV